MGKLWCWSCEVHRVYLSFIIRLPTKDSSLGVVELSLREDLTKLLAHALLFCSVWSNFEF